MNKNFCLFLFFVLALFIVQPYIYAEDEQPDQKGAQTQQKFEGFNLQGYTGKGEKSWDVNGATADVNGTEVILSNVDANSYGDENVNVKADKGVIDQSNGKMRLEKDVVVTSEKGSQLLTDSLDWDRKEDLVSTDDDVFLKDEHFTASGTGMKAHPGLKNAEIKENVTVRVNSDQETKGNKVVTITCDGPMVIDQALSKATFSDNVVAIQEDQTLRADRMEVYFTKGMNGIDQIVCTGNVEIVQGENKTYAEKATYSAKTQKVTLSGKPKLIFVTEGEDAITTFGN